MNITLMYKDSPILEFSYRKQPLGYQYSILSDYNKDLLPFGVKDAITLETWLMERVISISREHIEMVLASLGVEDKDYLKILLLCRGLSLNDSYWLREDGDHVSWKDINLYANDFKQAMMYVTFFGQTSGLGGKISTPELTTAGVLGKCWRRVDGNLYLYKKGTSGYANAGKEVFSEAVASRLLEVINQNTPSVPWCRYELLYWHKTLCTRCKLFSSEDMAYIPMKVFMRASIGNVPWTYQRVIDNFRSLKEGIDDMMVIDYLIENKDRHFGNFGALYNVEAGNLLSIAPIFDNGASLMCYGLDAELEAMTDKSEIGTFEFSNYEQARSVLSRRHKDWLSPIEKSIDYIVGEDLVKLANKHGELISNLRVEAIKKLILTRCQRLRRMEVT